jgi:hypothetical protein
LRGATTLREVSIYDPRSDRWRAGPTLPRPMELVGAAATRYEIHAVWESTYQIFDARTGSWRSGPPPLARRHALAAFVIGDRLFTLGGCRTPELVDTQIVEVRDLETHGTSWPNF